MYGTEGKDQKFLEHLHEKMNYASRSIPDRDDISTEQIMELLDVSRLWVAARSIIEVIYTITRVFGDMNDTSSVVIEFLTHEAEGDVLRIRELSEKVSNGDRPDTISVIRDFRDEMDRIVSGDVDLTPEIINSNQYRGAVITMLRQTSAFLSESLPKDTMTFRVDDDNEF